MQGLEVALVRLATTVIGTVARSLVTPRPGAGLVPDPLRPLPRPAKPDRLAKVLGRSAAEWPLETAYISLSVSGNGARQDWLEHPATMTVSVEQALSGTDRLLLRGPAGSGKSTLVQWLAVNAARRTFGTDLMDWNRCVPFVLRLRAFTSHEALPTPEEFLRAAGVPCTGRHRPAGWTACCPRDGAWCWWTGSTRSRRGCAGVPRSG